MPARPSTPPLRPTRRHTTPLLLLAAFCATAGAGPELRQWQVAGFSFEGHTDRAAIPAALRLDATFTGPDGSAYQVPGFWDGARTWRLRFTPTTPGEWSYETRASETDARVADQLFASPVLRGADPPCPVDVALDGAESLELVVHDAGDGSEYDHADWADARFVRRDGTTVYLDSLKPALATQGHGQLARGTNIPGQPLRLGDRTFQHGLGTHSPGRLTYVLDQGVARFQAVVGVDAHVGARGSIRFEVLASRRLAARADRRDPGLHGRRGRFTVLPAAGDNPLHRHGGVLRVGADGHSLTYADGTPFFWLGDTWWFCPSDLVPLDGSNNPAIPSAFRHLLQIRRRQGFTTIHMAFLGTINGYNPFDNPARGPGFDPAYWRQIDRYLAAANDCGLIPVIGLGWAGRPLSPDDWRLLWRHLIARCGAHAVTWLVCGEYNVRGAEAQVAGSLALGQFIKDTDPYHRAMTIHPWYFGGDHRQAWTQPWHDFAMLQGGHGAPPPVSVYLEAFSRQPAKPVLEGECRYEGIHTFTARDVREAAWRAIQCGSFGFTYGSQGLWYPTQHEHDRKMEEWGAPLVWWQAVERPGAEQLGHLRRFYQSVDWWRLAPRPDLPSAAPPAPEPRTTTVHDLLAHFTAAMATDAHWCRRGDAHPDCIDLHPPATGEAVLTFPPLTLPAVAPDERLLLVTALGFSPGARLDDPANPSNGVRFTARVDGTTIFQQHHHSHDWLYQAGDLTPHAGRTVSLSLATHAAGNMNWDHATFRHPAIVRAPATNPAPLRASLLAPPPRPLFAKADADRTIVIYFPPADGPAPWQLRPLPDGAVYQARWHNPRTAAASPPATHRVANSTLLLPPPPDPDDWVLILTRPTPGDTRAP